MVKNHEKMIFITKIPIDGKSIVLISIYCSVLISEFQEVRHVTGQDPTGATLVKIGFFEVNPVTKTGEEREGEDAGMMMRDDELSGQRLYMLHMLLLPFLPIVALIVQNSINLIDMLEYRRDSAAIGLKVDRTTALEKFITDLQRERAEVAFYIFTNGSQTLEMNLTTRRYDWSGRYITLFFSTIIGWLPLDKNQHRPVNSL